MVGIIGLVFSTKSIAASLVAAHVLHVFMDELTHEDSWFFYPLSEPEWYRNFRLKIIGVKDWWKMPPFNYPKWETVGSPTLAAGSVGSLYYTWGWFFI